MNRVGLYVMVCHILGITKGWNSRELGFEKGMDRIFVMYMEANNA